MRKCQECKLNKYKLKCLICEQKADDSYKILKPEIVTPLKNLSLATLTDREKAVLLLRIVTDVSIRRLSVLLGLSHPTISNSFRRAKEKLKELRAIVG